MNHLSLAGAGMLSLASFTAWADDPPPVYVVTDESGDAWNDDHYLTGIGVGVVVGGGVVGFTDRGMRDASSDAGGLWSARATIGTHIPIGVELGYVGSATPLQTLDNDNNGTLIGTTLEGALRYNVIPRAALTPYVFAGMGWQRYDVRGTNLALSDTQLRRTDDLIEFPMGAGISYRDLGGLVLDLRGTFRAATESTLLVGPVGDDPRLHTWEASGAIGFVF